MSDDEAEFDDVVYEALSMAMREFQRVVSNYLYDPAYCDLRFTAYIKDCTLTERLKRIEIEDECK